MAFNSFPGFQAQSSLQIIQYEGPPKPKQRSQQPPSKIPSHAERGDEEGFMTTLDEVELVDLTGLADVEGNCKICGSEGESGDVDRGDKNPHPRELSRGCSQGTTVIINGSQSDPEADTDDRRKEDAGLHIGDWCRVSSASTPGCNEREVTIGTIDVINSKTVDKAKTEAASKLWQWEPTPPTSPSMKDTEQSKQEHPTKKQVEREVRLPTVGSVCSGSSSESDTDDDNHHGRLTKLLTRKRTNPTLANSANRKRQSRGPIGTKHMGRQGKPSISQNDARLASETQSSDTELRYGEDRSDESGEDSGTPALNCVSAPPRSGNNVRNSCSDDSSENGSEDHFRHTEGMKRPMLAVHPHPSRKHKPTRTDNAADDDEYEVKGILNARMSGQKLQYRVKWLGFKYDLMWYDARNFKNSPYKLRDFHSVNRSHPGPPKKAGDMDTVLGGG